MLAFFIAPDMALPGDRFHAAPASTLLIQLQCHIQQQPIVKIP